MRLILGMVIGARCDGGHGSKADGELGRGRQECRRRDRDRPRGLEEDCGLIHQAS
jgi:hypothetical protein